MNAQEVPAGQSIHSLALVSPWYVPSTHEMHSADPATAAVPTSHATGIAVPELGHIVPAGQSVHVSAAAVDVSPGLHNTHESLDATAYDPASQGTGHSTPCPPQK